MSFVAVSLFHAFRRSFTLFAYLLVRALSARITFIAVCPNADILCYFMLCFVLFFASWLSFIAVSLWKAPAHIHNVATLQPKKMNIVIVRSNDELKLPIHRFVAFLIYTLYNIFAVLGKNHAEKCQNRQPNKEWWFFYSIINYVTKMTNQTFSHSSRVSSWSCTPRVHCGLANSLRPMDWIVSESISDALLFWC